MRAPLLYWLVTASIVGIVRPADAQVVVGQPRVLNEVPFLSPPEVDRDNPRLRLAFLAPQGPSVIEATLTIDGVPFQVARETLLDESLRHVDTDGDGRPTWMEAIESTGFHRGRLAQLNDQVRVGVRNKFDIDRDGLVSRAEARRFLAMYYQATFLLSPSAVAAMGNGTVYFPGASDVRRLLDRDADGVLKGDEIAKATEVLRALDADQNEWVLPNEVVPGGAANVPLIPAPSPPSLFLVSLGDEVSDELLFELVKLPYADSHGEFSVQGRLGLAALDGNGDGRLTLDEVCSLRTQAPSLRWSTDIAARAESAGITSVEAELPFQVVEQSPDKAVIQREGVRLLLAAQRQPTPLPSFDQSAQAYLNSFDKDQNGYIEQGEISESQRTQWRMWDADGDGKVYLAEIAASFQRVYEPMLGQVRASLTRSPDELFRRLDGNLDGRLSLRETAAAVATLRELDRDHSDSVTADEIPEDYSISLAVGTGALQMRPGMAGGFGAALAAPGTSGESDEHEWFRRMDRNGDGDLSIREFLGTREQFQRLDRDSDGLVSLEEATK